MKQLLRNFKTVLLVSLLLLAVAPSAKAWTALELFPGGGSIPGYEAVHGNYVQRSLPQWSYGGIEAGVNANNTNQIIIFGMFEGMVNAAFNITESGGKTYATLVTNSYGYLYTTNEGYGNTVAVNRQIRFTYDSYGVAVYPQSVDLYGNYSRASQWRGEVTKEPDGSISIIFTTPVRLRYTDSDNYFYSNDTYFNAYQVKLYPWNASVTDRLWLSDNSDMYYADRDYKTQITFFANNQFSIANWAGFGQGLETKQTSNSALNAESTFHVMEGYMKPEEGKVYMKRMPWMHDIKDVNAYTSNVFGTIRRFELRPVENPSALSGIITNERDVEGTLTLGVPAHENENDLWATPHGNLKTTANTVMSFEPFAAYSKELSAVLAFRVQNTVITCPTQDVTLEIKHEALRLLPGTTETSLLPVTATASFSVAKNDMFVESFDVYLVEGNTPKGSNTFFLGNVKKNKENFYSVETQFDLPSPDGKNWSTHKGESYSYPYSLKVVANYASATPAPAADGKRMAAVSLSPSSHGLGSGAVGFTVGVGGIMSDGGVQVEATQNGVMVTAPTDITVQVYNAAGVLVAEGRANTEILFAGNGVYIVKAGDQVRKLMK